MGCACGKNQTRPDVLADAKQRNLDPKSAKGVGLFRVPAPDVGILEWKVVSVEGIPYEECIKRGDNCEAYQWIPLGFVYNYQDDKGVKQTVTINSSKDIPRVQCSLYSCGPGVFCPLGCFCPGSTCN
jgi:hypothetical protein